MSNQETASDQLLQQTQQWLQQDAEHRLAPLLSELHPSDTAQLVMSLPAQDRLRVWPYIPEQKIGLVLLELPDSVRADLLEMMEASKLAEVLQRLKEDKQADLIQDIPERTEEILQVLDADRRQRLETVLYYPQDVAGGIMDVDMVSVRVDVSVSVVLRYMRQLGSLPEGTNKLFVTDRLGHYEGQVLLSSLITVSPDCLIGDIVDREAVTIDADTNSKQVAEIFAKYNLISVAVVDQRKRLLGRITVEDIVDLLIELEQQAKSKLPLASHEDAFSSVWLSSRSRFLWLGVNLLTALLASWVIGNFEQTLVKMVSLAVLMPVVASMGGIAGTQTMSLVIRSLALGQLQRSNQWWLLVKELKVGALNGFLWALIISSIAWLWFDSIVLSGVIGVAILINLLVATGCGVMVPVLMNRLEIDPAISGGVVLTTITDVVGFLFFLGLASLLV